MNLIFLYPVFKGEAIRLQDVASHAANAWMTGLSGALLAEGVGVRTVGHEPARVWPLGRHLLPGDPEHLQSGFPQRLVKYVNMPLVRHFFLCRGYRKAVCGELIEWKDAFVCTYNPLQWQVYAAGAAVRKGAQWISFVLDDEVVAIHGWARYVRQTQSAIGHVFVSQWAYEQAPVKRKFMMEGGVEAWRGREKEALSAVPSVMYAGQLCTAAGAKELLALIDTLTSEKVEFWICGKGVSTELAQRAARDPRIKLLGFLSEVELDQRLQSAWVLINPRSAAHEASRMNFPSKLSRYLGYGKPIVTVWTPGIPAEYRDVLLVVEPELCGFSPARLGLEMGRRVGHVLQWNQPERRAWQEKIHQFVIPQKLWSSQVKRLLEFMGSCES